MSQNITFLPSRINSSITIFVIISPDGRESRPTIIAPS